MNEPILSSSKGHDLPVETSGAHPRRRWEDDLQRLLWSEQTLRPLGLP